jgi:hypothetical protein
VLRVQGGCDEGAASIGQSATRSSRIGTKSETAMKTARKWRAAKVSLSQIVASIFIHSQFSNGRCLFRSLSSCSELNYDETV